MIKSYIYGTPKGFDFYPQNRTLENYLKDFYRTTRTGKRLMINRRANGETIYSYLRYGLMEYNDLVPNSTERQAGRPNAFFGMSLVLDSNVYSPDFHRLLEWFDFWFDRILQEGAILKETQSGTIQYQVAKFKNNESYINHICANLPNIFSEKANTKTATYDASFEIGESAEIPLLNSEVDPAKLLHAFKTHSWIGISPDFGDASIPEINDSLLRDKFNEISKYMVTYAIRRSHNDIPELQKMANYIQYAVGIINQYIASPFANAETSHRCSSLLKEYTDMRANIENLIKGIEQAQQSSTPPTDKECNVCHQHKPISAFRTPNDSVCIACSTNGMKQCHKCGLQKHAELFYPNDNICKSCRSKEQPPVPIWINIIRWIASHAALFALVGLLAASGIVGWKLFNEKSKTLTQEELIAKVNEDIKPLLETNQYNEAVKHVEKSDLYKQYKESADSIINNRISPAAVSYFKPIVDGAEEGYEKFAEIKKIYSDQGQFEKLPECDTIFKTAAIKALWRCINGNIANYNVINKFYEDNIKPLNLDVNNILDNTKTVCDLIAKGNSITSAEKKNAEYIINKSDYKYNRPAWLGKIPNPTQAQSNGPSTSYSTIIVKTLNNQYGIIQQESIAYDAKTDITRNTKLKVNQFVDIVYNQGDEIQHVAIGPDDSRKLGRNHMNNSRTYRIQFKQSGNYVIYVKWKNRNNQQTEITVKVEQ